MVTTLTADRLAELYDEGAAFALVDTRPEESYEAWRAPGARHFPFDPVEDLDGRLAALRDLIGDDDRVVTICGKGVSSGTLAAALTRATDAYDVAAVEGGMQAWSGVYHHAPVDVGEGVAVVQIQRRAKGCLGYLVADPDSGVAAVVDPTDDVEEYLLAAGERGWEIEAVVDSHVHADHVSGGRDLADRLSVPYYLPARASDRGVERAFEPLADGDVVAVGDVALETLYTPGHTSDIVSLAVDDRAILTADTLHADSTGRTELEFGDEAGDRGARLLYESLHETVLERPDDVVVLPGHVAVSTDGEYGTGAPGEPIATTIGDVRGLDVLELDEDAFVERLADAGEKPANYEEIIDVNRGVGDVEPEERVELEMGPNNCSA